MEHTVQLLSNANQLQGKYGLHAINTSLRGNLSVVSKSNLDIFRGSLVCFLAQNPKEVEKRKRRAWLKAKWGISDQQQFRGFINDVKDLVDQLLMIPINFRLLVDADHMDREMRIDIKLVENLDHLSLVEEACEDSYRAWSKYAASVRAESEMGATERRTLEETTRNLQLDQTLCRGLEAKKVSRYMGSSRTGMKCIFSENQGEHANKI